VRFVLPVVAVLLLIAVVVLDVRLRRVRGVQTDLALAEHDNEVLTDEVAKLKADLFCARDQLDIVEAVADKFQADVAKERALRTRAETDAAKVAERLLVEKTRTDAEHRSALAARDAEHAQQLGALSRLLAVTALPAPPSPPELLPSGQHALVKGNPDVLVQLDDNDLDDLGVLSLAKANTRVIQGRRGKR
jgi:hypothetical protein